jgi:hypothetical protein
MISTPSQTEGLPAYSVLHQLTTRRRLKMNTSTVKDIFGAILFLLLMWGTSYLFLLLERL